MNNAITTESIAELVRSHGTIPAPDVGKHFGQPHWTREIESAAKPLIESGQITISAEHGVVWNHDFQGDLYIAVPHELKARRQWVMWRWAKREGEDKPTKPPYKPTSRFLNRQKAKNNDPYTWTDFQSVCKPRLSDTPCFGVLPKDYDDRGTECGCVFSGIGYVFSEDDPYCGIDIDDCLDDQENLKAWAEPIVKRLKAVAYGEVSPSGNGIKFWTKAKLPDSMNTGTKQPCEDGAIEAYHRKRYFTVTGRGKGEIADGQSEVDWLVEQYLKPEPLATRTEQGTHTPASSSNLSADEVIAKIKNSPQRYKFEALMKGDIKGYHHEDGKPDPSRADLGLCSILAYWSQEHAVIDAIFRQSDLIRPKWDKRHRADKATYGEMTIEEALSGKSETYQTKRKPQSKTKRRLYRDQKFYGRKR